MKTCIRNRYQKEVSKRDPAFCFGPFIEKTNSDLGLGKGINALPMLSEAAAGMVIDDVFLLEGVEIKSQAKAQALELL